MTSLTGLWCVFSVRVCVSEIIELDFPKKDEKIRLKRFNSAEISEKKTQKENKKLITINEPFKN